MKNDYDVAIPFSLSPTVLEGAATTAVTIATLGTNAALARIPRLLQLHLKAGDVYTVGAPARLEIKDNNGVVLFSVSAVGLLDQATAQYVVCLPTAEAIKSGATSFTLAVTGTLTKGTASGTLYGKIHFDELGFLLN